MACRFLFSRFFGFLEIISAVFADFILIWGLWWVDLRCESFIVWNFTFNCVGFVMVHVVFTWVWLG